MLLQIKSLCVDLKGVQTFALHCRSSWGFPVFQPELHYTQFVLQALNLVWLKSCMCLLSRWCQSEEKSRVNSSQEHRLRELEGQYAEATTLLHVQGSLVSDLQAQIHNLSMLVEKVRRNPGCMINIVRTSPLLSTQHTLHPGMPIQASWPHRLRQGHVQREILKSTTVEPPGGALPCRITTEMELVLDKAKNWFLMLT